MVNRNVAKKISFTTTLAALLAVILQTKRNRGRKFSKQGSSRPKFLKLKRRASVLSTIVDDVFIYNVV